MTAHFNFISGKLRYAWELVSDSGNNHVTNQGRIIPKFFLSPSFSGGVSLAFLEYTTANVSSFQLRQFSGSRYNVDWGDGTTDTNVTVTLKTHTYSSAGVYTIKITPVEGFLFRPEHYGAVDYQTNLTKVDGTGGSSFNTDLTKWLRETSSLTSFGSSIDLSHVTVLQAVWRQCTGLTSFPPLNLSSATNLISSWERCSNLTSFGLIDSSGAVNMSYAWLLCSGLTAFPAIDTSSVNNFNATWNGCSGLTSFPTINTSSGNNFRDTWNGCSGLTTFPLLDTSSGTTFQGSWINCSGLTSFPALNTSSVTNFRSAWQNCSAITTFPSINTSSATDFRNSWQNCSSLTTYPANQFNSTGTLIADAFNSAWVNCALTAQSIENILTSLDTNGAQNITLGIHGGTNAAKSTWSTATNTAYTNLINKGWTISFNS